MYVHIHIYLYRCMCGFICVYIYIIYILFLYFYFHFYFILFYLFLILIANNLLHCFLSTKIQCVFFIHKYSLIQDATSWFGYTMQAVSQYSLQINKYLLLQWLFCPPITLCIHLYFCFKFFCYFNPVLHQFIYVFEPYILFTMNNLFN